MTGNDTISPRPPNIPRDMTTWSYDAIKDLLTGSEFALHVNVADREAVLFSAADRLWLFATYPSGGWSQAAPEVVTDWIGASAPKEPGGEPVLMHCAELPGRASGLVEDVRDDPPEHVYDELARYADA